MIVVASGDIDDGDTLWIDYGKEFSMDDAPLLAKLDAVFQSLRTNIHHVLNVTQGSQEVPISVEEHTRQPGSATNFSGLDVHSGGQHLVKLIHQFSSLTKLDEQYGQELRPCTRGGGQSTGWEIWAGNSQARGQVKLKQFRNMDHEVSTNLVVEHIKKHTADPAQSLVGRPAMPSELQRLQQ